MKPKFQKSDKLEGVGYSIKWSLATFNSGCFFIDKSIKKVLKKKGDKK
jgi:hypothetical protein